MINEREPAFLHMLMQEEDPGGFRPGALPFRFF